MQWSRFLSFSLNRSGRELEREKGKMIKENWSTDNLLVFFGIFLSVNHDWRALIWKDAVCLFLLLVILYAWFNIFTCYVKLAGFLSNFEEAYVYTVHYCFTAKLKLNCSNFKWFMVSLELWNWTASEINLIVCYFRATSLHD